MHLLTLSNGINNPYFCYQENRSVIISVIITPAIVFVFLCTCTYSLYLLQTSIRTGSQTTSASWSRGSRCTRATPCRIHHTASQATTAWRSSWSFSQVRNIPYLTIEFLNLNCKNFILSWRVFPATPLVDTLTVTPLPFGYVRCNIAPTEIRHSCFREFLKVTSGRQIYAELDLKRISTLMETLSRSNLQENTF